MSKGEAKPDEQQRLMSFRVDDVIMRKVEALKERFLATGKKASTSELARCLLEAATIQNGEFGELLANAADSVRNIHRLAQSSQPLTRAQWELISFLIHDAYRSNPRQMVKGKYFSASLQAFAAWRRLASRNDDQYFLSNLRRTDSNDLLGRIEELVATMPALVSNGEAEFGSRNFNVAMRDEIADINALELNAALMPHLLDLLPVVTRAVHLRTRKPLYEKERDFLAHPIRPTQTKRYWLNILVSGDSFTAAIDLTTHRAIHPINSFLQFQELFQLFDEISPYNPSASSEHYWLTGPVATVDDYQWRYYGHQTTLAPDEFAELRELFALALQQPDVQNAVREMTRLYGDI